MANDVFSANQISRHSNDWRLDWRFAFIVLVSSLAVNSRRLQIVPRHVVMSWLLRRALSKDNCLVSVDGQRSFPLIYFSRLARALVCVFFNDCLLMRVCAISFPSDSLTRLSVSQYFPSEQRTQLRVKVSGIVTRHISRHFPTFLRCRSGLKLFPIEAGV